MRIGMISTPFIPVPPPAYGGTELIVGELVDGLRALGHEVRLYTAGKPGPGGQALYRTPVWPPEPYHEMQHAAWALGDLVLAEPPIDVIHAHCAAVLPLARFTSIPIVYTIHHERTETHAALYAMQRHVQFVAISARQRELHPEVRGHCDVVLHGLEAQRYPLGPGGDVALFLGRLSRAKGPAVALDVARQAGCRIVVAGRPHPGDEEYWRDELVPRLGAPGAAYVGEVGWERKLPLLRHARATLFPVGWEEPFGLVMIESMLCGTPVLAFARGSVPEVVDEGVTGFICRDAGEMAARLRWLAGASRHSVHGFDRRRCRARAVERFGRSRMVRDYLAVYTRARAHAEILALRAADAEEPLVAEGDGNFGVAAGDGSADDLPQ